MLVFALYELLVHLVFLKVTVEPWVGKPSSFKFLFLVFPFPHVHLQFWARERYLVHFLAVKKLLGG